MNQELMISLDKKRTIKVFNTLIKLFEHNEIPWFCPEALPQNKFRPDSLQVGSYEHRCWLFFMAMLTIANNDSDDIFYRSLLIYKKSRELFLPRIAANPIRSETIKLFLERIFGNYNLELYTKAWQDNARLLGAEFNWDPLNIFKGVSNHQETRKVLKRFVNFGDKIASLLIEWFEEMNLVSRFFGPPPVDFHVLRTMICTECVSVPALHQGRVRADKITRRLVRLLEPFCERQQFSPYLDPSFWLWGRNMCSKWPEDNKVRFTQPRKNKFSRCYWCPLKDVCKYYFNYGSYRSKQGILLEPREDNHLYLFDPNGRPINFN